MSLGGFSERLRQLALALKVEHQVLARAGGVSKATFSNYVQGDKFPRMDTIANWILKYGVNANWLIAGKGAIFLDGTAEKPQDVADDPVVARMQTVVALLRQANASDETIQSAILSTLPTTHSCPAK